jgi:hypothetical protein
MRRSCVVHGVHKSVSGVCFKVVATIKSVPFDQVVFLMLCLKHTGGKIDFNGIASEYEGNVSNVYNAVANGEAEEEFFDAGNHIHVLSFNGLDARFLQEHLELYVPERDFYVPMVC